MRLRIVRVILFIGIGFIGVNAHGQQAVAEFSGNNNKTTTAFEVDSYPDYYLIDRAGNLRVADLANADLERAVQVLLAEQPAIAPALAEASKTADFKDKRILVSWGSEAERAAIDSILKADRSLGKLLSNEYEVVGLSRADAPELAAALEAGEAGPALSALDANGALLARLDAVALDAQSLRAFLEASRVPQKDAEVLWRDALARAERGQKRVLVHLGAPW